MKLWVEFRIFVLTFLSALAYRKQQQIFETSKSMSNQGHFFLIQFLIEDVRAEVGVGSFSSHSYINS